MSLWPKPPGSITHTQLVGLLNEKLPLIEQRGNTLPVAGDGGLEGLIDPTDFGATTARFEAGTSGLANSWGALSAAIYATYGEELAGTATGGGTTTVLNDATASFSATWDDRIDAGAGPDFSTEVCFLSGSNKGRYSNIDVVNSGTQITLSPALPNAIAAGDEYRVLKSSRTQQRRQRRELRLPPGWMRIDDEIVAIRGAASFAMRGAGMGVSVLDFSNDANQVTASVFTSATPTTLTLTGAGWAVDQFKGKWVWTWDIVTAARPLYNRARILSNTSDTVTVASWPSATPNPAVEEFAIGCRSALFLNGFGGCTFSDFTVYTGTAKQFIMKIAAHWMRPGYTLPGAEDRVAFSTSQNVFNRVEAYGRSVHGSMHYGNNGYAQNNQVDNGCFIGCRFIDEWNNTNTDQRYSKAPLIVGDGSPGNAVINVMFGGSIYYGQNGVSVQWCDLLMVGTTLQSNGHRSLLNDASRRLGDVYILGLNNYFGMHGCRSELSSRLIDTSAGNAIWQQAEIVQCTFHVVDDTTFALDGIVVRNELGGGYWRLGGLWIYGPDPNGFASPRPAISSFTAGVVDVGAVAAVESNIETFFPAGATSTILLNGVYARLNSDNTIQKRWVGGGKIHPNIGVVADAGDSFYWESVSGTAPDVAFGRSQAGAFAMYDASGQLGAGALVASGTQTPGSIFITDGRFSIYSKRLTLTGTQRVTVAGGGRLNVI